MLAHVPGANGAERAVLMRTEAKCWLLLTDVGVSIDVCQQGQLREEAQTRWWTETLGMREKSCCKQRFQSFCLRARARPGAAAWLFIAALLNATPAQKAPNHRGDC